MKIKKIKTLPLPYLPHFHLRASITPSHTHTPASISRHLPPASTATPHAGLHSYSTYSHSHHSTRICLCFRLHMPAFTRRPPHAAWSFYSQGDLLSFLYFGFCLIMNQCYFFLNLWLWCWVVIFLLKNR